MKESINQKIMLALKTRNKIQLYVLRMIKAKFLEYETAKNAKELNESAEIQILKKMKSDWEKELGFLKEGQRDTSVIKSQLDVLNTYIPVVATKDEVMEALNNLKDVEISIKNARHIFPLVRETYPSAETKMIIDCIKEYVRTSNQSGNETSESI